MQVASPNTCGCIEQTGQSHVFLVTSYVTVFELSYRTFPALDLEVPHLTGYPGISQLPEMMSHLLVITTELSPDGSVSPKENGLYPTLTLN